MSSTRVDFTYSRLTRVLLTPFRMGPRHSWVEVDDDEIDVRMGWAFRATIPRRNITAVETSPPPKMVGAHGWKGHWRVVATRARGVTLELQPPVGAKFNGIPLTVRRLTLGVDQARLPGTIR